MTTEQGNRDKIIERIAKMRASAESVASEAEAMVFATKAATMMEAYQISEAELALAEADGRVVFDIVEQTTGGARGKIDFYRVGKKAPSQHRANITLGAINKLTSTKCVIYTCSAKVGFMGHRPDVEMAIFLYEMFKTAMDREYESWKRSQINGVSRTAKGAFHIAMANRIANRLREYAAQQQAAREATVAEAHKGGDASAADHYTAADVFTADAPSIVDSSVTAPEVLHAAEVASTALTITDAKREEVRDSFQKAHPSLRAGSGFSMSHNSNGAYRAGSAAGDRVGFNRPLGNGVNSQQIGG